MATILQASGKVQLINVTQRKCKDIERVDYNGITQYKIPLQHSTKEKIETLSAIEKEHTPDIIHIWGTEGKWLYLIQKCQFKAEILLEIQGILFAYHQYYYGGLFLKEILQSIHLKEIIMPWRTLPYKRKVFRKRGEKEIAAIRQIRHISVQSDWSENQLKTINHTANFYHTKIALREQFYEAEKWIYHRSNTPVIFSSCNAAVTYKGIHQLIKTIAILKPIYPNIQLRLAGTIDVGNKLLDGYSIFLKKLAKRLDVSENIKYIGRLSANELIKELHECNVCVIPSFVETYCLAFAEAMIIGVPCVTAFSGAMPELALHKQEALFYTPEDVNTCAAYIDRLIQDKNLATRLSTKARDRRLMENNSDEIIKTQLDIYENVLHNKHL